jgi:metal-responsive CopG/Arc/MetJ family transcriptional regulator
MQVVTVKMSFELLMKIDALARKIRTSRAAIIRSAIEHMLSSQILPPSTDAEKYDIVVSVKMPRDLLTELDKFAEKHKLERSDIVRRAVEQYYKMKTEDEGQIRARVERIRF